MGLLPECRNLVLSGHGLFFQSASVGVVGGGEEDHRDCPETGAISQWLADLPLARRRLVGVAQQVKAFGWINMFQGLGCSSWEVNPFR